MSTYLGISVAKKGKKRKEGKKGENQVPTVIYFLAPGPLLKSSVSLIC